MSSASGGFVPNPEQRLCPCIPLGAENAEPENAGSMMSENEGPNRSMENAGLKMQERKMLDRKMLDQNFVIKI